MAGERVNKADTKDLKTDGTFHNDLFWRQLPGGVHPHPNLPPEGEGTFEIIS